MTTQDDRWYVNPWTPGDRFRKAREHAGLDQTQLAEIIGASRQTVSNYENGATTRHVKAIVRAWALATGVTTEWLMTGTPGGNGPTNGTAAPAGGRNGGSSVAGAGFEPATSGTRVPRLARAA